MENTMSASGMRGMHVEPMMNMCKDDTAMYKMMMGKTMEMCNADSAKCKMTMGSMISHPDVMNAIDGMCEKNKMK